MLYLSKPILDGSDFKNHICATGAAKSICPILSLLTFAKVTSTPHFSQTTPLMLHSFIFTTNTFVIFYWAKYFRTK